MSYEKELVFKIHQVLNLIKDFECGYSSKSAHEGKMIIQYMDKRFVVKMEQLDNPNEDFFKDIDRLEYYS